MILQLFVFQSFFIIVIIIVISVAFAVVVSGFLLGLTFVSAVSLCLKGTVQLGQCHEIGNVTSAVRVAVRLLVACVSVNNVALALLDGSDGVASRSVVIT